MRKVFTSHNQLLVHHARNLLEAAGIRSELRKLALASAMGELPPAECEAELWVGEDQYRRAGEILAQRETPGSAWHCLKCGEPGEPQFAQCWRCEADRP